MKASRLGLLLWTLAAAVLVHAVVRQLALDGVCTWLVDLWGAVIDDEALRARLADATWLSALLGGLPLLAGIQGRPKLEALGEFGLGAAITTFAAVALLGPLDLLVDALDGSRWVSVILLGAIALAALFADGCAGRLRTLIGVEWLKVRRGRLLRTGLAVVAIATLLAGFSYDGSEDVSAWPQAVHTLGVGFWTAEILVLVLGATLVAGEISQSTMKMILPHAYRRAEWIAAKASVLVLCALLFAMVVVGVGLGHTLLDEGLDDVTREGMTEFGEESKTVVFQTVAEMRERLIASVSAATASLVASALVGLLLSCVFHSLVPALSASFLVFAALKTGKIFLGFSEKTLSAIYAHYPDKLREQTTQFGKALNEGWDETLLPSGLYLALLTSVLGLLISLRLFGRRDLHG